MHWCQDLELEPILAVWDGFYLSGPVTPQSELGVWIQFALDELEFLMGSTSTKYGALRASLGYPEPFQINYVEVNSSHALKLEYPRANTLARSATRTILVAAMPVTLLTVFPCSPKLSRQSILTSPSSDQHRPSTPFLITSLLTTMSTQDLITLSESLVSSIITTEATPS